MTAPQSVTTAKETVTGKMARWAAKLQYSDLSQDAIYQAKRFLLDSIGCALGGYQQHDVKNALEVLREISGRGPATVIGTGERVDPVSAALANALMIRCMDYNDIYWKQDPCHPSDIFSAALACCERAGSGGKELIVGLVLGHEFEMRFCEAAFPGIRERGWHHATLTAFVSPIVAGRALHLTWEQIQHAIGISASRHCTLGAVTAGKLTMMKNTVDPMATQSGVFAALLAEKGYTGPEHVVDGKEGLTHVFGPEWKLNLLTDCLGESWRITQCGMSSFFECLGKPSPQSGAVTGPADLAPAGALGEALRRSRAIESCRVVCSNCTEIIVALWEDQMKDNSSKINAGLIFDGILFDTYLDRARYIRTETKNRARWLEKNAG